MESKEFVHDIHDAANEMRLIDQAAEFLKNAGMEEPEIAVVLGTGLGDYADRLENAIAVPYGEIPGFKVSTAPGHRGTMYYGHHLGKNVMVMCGRLHCYEGYAMNETVFPIRVMARMGVKKLLITNAAGAIDFDATPGDLMLATDHINFSGTSPLLGENLEEMGPRFPDLTNAYDAEWREAILKAASEAGMKIAGDGRTDAGSAIRTGVYAMMLGPYFETPAEIRMLRVVGANAVGMSSVPEAIVAAHSGLKTAMITCLSNAAAGVLPEPLSSDHVEKVASMAAESFAKLVDIAISL